MSHRVGSTYNAAGYGCNCGGKCGGGTLGQTSGLSNYLFQDKAIATVNIGMTNQDLMKFGLTIFAAIVLAGIIVHKKR